MHNPTLTALAAERTDSYRAVCVKQVQTKQEGNQMSRL